MNFIPIFLASSIHWGTGGVSLSSGSVGISSSVGPSYVISSFSFLSTSFGSSSFEAFSPNPSAIFV